jgi:hypothetical protein
MLNIGSRGFLRNAMVVKNVSDGSSLPSPAPATWHSFGGLETIAVRRSSRVRPGCRALLAPPQERQATLARQHRQSCGIRAARGQVRRPERCLFIQGRCGRRSHGCWSCLPRRRTRPAMVSRAAVKLIGTVNTMLQQLRMGIGNVVGWSGPLPSPEVTVNKRLQSGAR